MNTTKIGAMDEDETAYGTNGVCITDEYLPSDKYGVNLNVDGSLRKSKKKRKKKKKQHSAKPKAVVQQRKASRDIQHQPEVVERSRLPLMLDTATIQSPVCISVRLVHDFVSNENKDFRVLQGETVIARFRKKENVFVQCFNGTYGFVPARFCYLVDVYPITEFLDVNLVELVNSLQDGKRHTEVSKDAEEDSRSISNEVKDCGEQRVGGIVESKVVDADVSHQVEADPIGLREQDESDTLLRRIKKHEIRQLMKREIGKKILADNAASIPIVSSESNNPTGQVQEPIRGEEDVAGDLIGQKSAESGASVKVMHNGGISTPIHSSLSSIQKNSNEMSTNRVIDSVAQDIPKPQGNSDVNSDINGSDIDMRAANGVQTEMYRNSKIDENHHGVLRRNGYFYNRDDEAVYSEAEAQRTIDDQSRHYILSNRRCTSLRKITTSGPGKFPTRTYSMRYPSSYGCDSRGSPMTTSFNGSLPRTPGSIQYLSPNAHNYDDISDTLSINSIQSNCSCNSIQYGGGNQVVIGVHDFISPSRDDLSFAKGERLFVIRKDSEGWWWVRNGRGQEGFVPSRFIAAVEQINSGGRVINLLPPLLSRRRTGIEEELVDGCSDREDPRNLVQSGLVSPETRKLLENRLDWQRLYCRENSRLAVVMPNLRSKFEEEDDRSSIESKEELLKRIRSEIERDPVSSYAKFRSKMPTMKETSDQDILGAGFDDKSYGNMKENDMNVANKGRVRLKLPSYTEYVERKSRLYGGNDDYDNQSFQSSSFSDVSNLDGTKSETPRALRRRKTYSGTSNKKVRFNQSDTSSNLPCVQPSICEDEDLSTKMHKELSTWC
eukprot:gene11976-13213_t